MPRSVVLGNHQLLAQYDSRYRLRDLFFPLTSGLNHVSGHYCRLGIWFNNTFHWLDSDEWQWSFANGEHGAWNALARGVGVEVRCHEWIAADRPMLVREFDVILPEWAEGECKFFVHFDFRMHETEVGDTALYLPEIDAMCHYKRGVYVFANGDEKIHEYACGNKGFDGAEGTWRDAEDGHLSGRPIEQGSVDFTFSLVQPIFTGQPCRFVTRLWCSQTADFSQPPPKVTPLQLPTNERSAYLIHAHTATNGAILAASDSEILQTGRSTYAYVWPRDSALVAMAMADAGFPEHLEQNGRFILDHIQPNQPYLLQKFCPDGNLGSTWHAWTREAHFQQDETALTVLSMCELLLNHNAPEDAQSWFERFIEPACEWMVEYVDPENGLPRASFDLWEERLDVHSWTVCTVISALRSAAWTADFMGRLDLHDRWQQAAEAYKTAFEKHLIDQKTMVVRRSLGSDLVDSSILAVELFDIFPADHPVVTATLERVRETLSVGGGIARYEGDYYYREGDGYSGNPWVICSLWVAQVLLMQDKVSEADGYIDWVRSVSLGGGLLPEQVGGLSGQIVGVCPLVWSHAEWLRTVTLRARVVGD